MILEIRQVGQKMGAVECRKRKENNQDGNMPAIEEKETSPMACF